MIAVEFEDLDLSNVSKCLGCTYSSNLLVFSQNVNHILRREEASCSENTIIEGNPMATLQA
jgi:hypothetical protein